MKSSHSFSENALIATTDDDRGYLTFNRPESKNAINFRMWQEIPLALDWLCSQGDIRCIIMRGEGGRDFSAGADITEFEQMRQAAPDGQAYERSNTSAFRAVRLCQLPVLAMINGICFGGAFGLAAAADLRIASNEALFAIPAGRLGLAYPVDAMSDIVEALGPQRAGSLLYTGGRMTARDAQAVGFILSTCGLADLNVTMTALADQICANAPISNRASKAAIRAVLTGNKEDRLLAEDLARSTFDSSDYEEGRLAFREKRKPTFSGH